MGKTTRRARLAGLALLCLLAIGSAVALSGAARAETGAPALEPDGVWRARGDWTVEAGEVVVHEARTIEAFGNVSIGPGAVLAMRSVSLTFVAAGGAEHVLTANAGARLEVSNFTLLAEGVLDRLEAFHAVIEADACTLRFRHTASVAAAVDGFGSQVNLTGCVVESDADVVLRVRNGSGFNAMDCDFRRTDGQAADIFVGAPSSARLDTTRFAALRTLGGPNVVGYATVRFFLYDEAGYPQAGNVNGTGPWGEHFALFTAPNATAGVRLKWFDYAAAPAEVSLEGRTPGQPMTFTAVSPGVGANNSGARLAAHRVNVTVALLGSFDLSVESFAVFGQGLEGPPLKRAYFVELNDTQAVLLRVKNRGIGPSPPVRFNLTLTALAPDSWAPLETRFEETVEVPALTPGDSANFSIPFVPGAFGGFKDDSGDCFTSISYTSALTAALVDNLSADFAAWNNARSFTLVAFHVEGDPTGACAKPGTDLLPYLALAGGGAVAAVAFITHRFSDREVAKRAARAPPPPTKPPSGGEEGQPPLP